MPVTAPTPMQPSPVEIQQWETGRGNARQQYLQQQAQTNYQKSQTTLGNQMQQQQLAYNQGQQRQQFDDPYIARGIFNSGIRGGGLQNFYTNYAQQNATAQQQYLQQMGQLDLNDIQAGANRDTTLGNIDAAEQARRADLAAQIKGIV
jgi:hypothetical protein